MNNNVYEAPKAIILNVNACDVITTSGGPAPTFNSIDDVLGDGWFSAEQLVD